MKTGFRIGPFTLNTGAGSQTINTELPPIDLSGRDSIRAVLSITKAITDAADTYDVYIQSLMPDGLTWNDRGHFGQITGADTPTATAPEVRVLNIQSRIELDATEEAYETSGSLDAPRLAAGSVRNGAFPSKQRGSTGWIANWRIQQVVVDSDNDCDFEGTLTLEVS